MLALDFGRVVLDHPVIGNQPEGSLASERVAAQIHVPETGPVESLEGVGKPERRGIVGVAITRATPVIIPRDIQQKFIGHTWGDGMYPSQSSGVIRPMTVGGAHRPWIVASRVVGSIGVILSS